jgi:hypothetical protein
MIASICLELKLSRPQDFASRRIVFKAWSARTLSTFFIPTTLTQYSAFTAVRPADEREWGQSCIVVFRTRLWFPWDGFRSEDVRTDNCPHEGPRRRDLLLLTMIASICLELKLSRPQDFASRRIVFKA